ncbi:uncharacterized protein LOC128599809 isoform X1 [Ictalurus furcatus]|uniref:uncharacterized protein LOC128599809 isoform X1 n=1 Tax=Ictalurus furcatus TaxID=66913 RepID=UPI002350781C|nr:uncharacterized protein LOC128599809 isoform X1 [Ictalurus furcatus]XP_053467752.1 uncharacterized protein LOC128599809 isoform X1 [Ictalurus furcatus]XP_053467754.1 uncharacterized protein LOC128599809 isoform X1 [Ictalurus furcatus]XP_053467755.1 uncharacterized protein LOC128599809 isoform X1 [Ictalurus furcatus]
MLPKKKKRQVEKVSPFIYYYYYYYYYFTLTAKMEDYIDKLKHFSKLDFQSKLEVINNGRPTPELKDLLQTTGQKITRSFHTEWYTRKDWLCGCASRNRLFCFPCLLFTTSDNVWTTTGFCDLKNIPRSLSRHESSTSHIQSQIALKTFGSTRRDLALNEQRRLNISAHNAKVKENREVLKHLINATCFLAKQQLAFGANDESTSSPTRSNYVELLHAFAEKDDGLARHLETSSVFSGSSNRIQNDLIDVISDVIRNDIKREINAALFVAVEVDETTDVTDKAQISVILRYVAISEVACEVREAFLGFDDVSNDRREAAIAEYILGVLEKYKCVEKLVAQTYDGAAVMASELNGVQAKIKEKVPEAFFTHCYAHKLNLVLMHSAKCMPQTRTFFKTVEGLGTFFRKSTKRTRLLDDVVKRRSPRAAPTRWSSTSRLLQTISMHQSDLRAVFHIMGENPGSWDNDTLMMATGYDQWLAKASTCFFIMAYEDIFSETDALFRALQSNVMDIGFCRARIRDTIGVVERQRQEFDSFYERFERKCATLGLTDSVQSKQSVRDERKRMFHNVLDDISVQLKARFDHFGELAFFGLVDCTKFEEMLHHFDDTKMQSLSKYARYFDFVRLKADLIGLYSSQTVRNECKSPGQLLSFLAQKDLMKTVPEATKLLQLVLTIPATAVSVERSFSALKRLRTYSRNRTDQGRLSSLAMISIETERLLKLKEDKEDFYTKVIELFVQKDRRMDFIYKLQVKEKPEETIPEARLCPLCQSHQKDNDALSLHLTKKHSVHPACLTNLLVTAPYTNRSSSRVGESTAQNIRDGTSQQNSSESTTSPLMAVQQDGSSQENDACDEAGVGNSGSSYGDTEVSVKDEESNAAADGPPFKCHACLEYFTDKSALHVHFNSATHMQKMRTGAGNDSNSSSPVPAYPYVSTKPYQCDVCQVSYFYSFGLESHLKSVLHQSRTKKAGNTATNSKTNTETRIVVANLAGTTVANATPLASAKTGHCVTQAEKVPLQPASSLISAPVVSAQAMSTVLPLLTLAPNSVPHAIVNSVFPPLGTSTTQLIPQPQVLMPFIVNGLQTQSPTPDGPQQILQQAVPVLGLCSAQHAQGLGSSDSQSQSAATGVSNASPIRLETNTTVDGEGVKVKIEIKEEPCDQEVSQMTACTADVISQVGLKQEDNRVWDGMEDSIVCSDEQQSKAKGVSVGENSKRRRSDANKASATQDLQSSHVGKSSPAKCNPSPANLVKSTKTHPSLSSGPPVLSEFQSQVLWAFSESRNEADSEIPPREDCEALGREVGLTEDEVREWLVDTHRTKNRHHTDVQSRYESQGSTEDDEDALTIDESGGMVLRSNTDFLSDEENADDEQTTVNKKRKRGTDKQDSLEESGRAEGRLCPSFRTS